MLPYLIAGAIGYVVAKLFEDETPKFADGGLIAPNGKPSNLTYNQYKLVRTYEFKAWFGDWQNDPANASKVVDENGEPLVVWRGVKSNKNYEYQKTGYNYFAKNKSYGKVYGDILHPFFLNIRNPLDLEFFNKISSENGLTSFNNEGLFQIGETQLNNKFENELDLLYLQNLNDVYHKFDYLFKNGDGIIGYDIGSYGDELVFVTKKPEQIKLADDSNTKFDSNNPDIRFNEGGSVLLAPNGKPSNLTPEQYKLVRLPEFKAWFGDWENDPTNASKVVDENGEPKIMYHQTSETIKDIIYNEGLFKKGFEVASKNDKETPYGFFFKKTKTDIGLKGKEQISVFLNSKKPLVFKTRGYINIFFNDTIYGFLENNLKYKTNDIDYDAQFQKEWQSMKNENIIYDSVKGKLFYEDFDKKTRKILDDWREKNDNISFMQKKLIENYLKDNQYDSMIIEYDEGSFGRQTDTTIVFESNQIKLADGTNTTFNGSNPDIRFDGGGRVSNYKQFYDNLEIEDGSKYIGQKFANVFPFFRRKQTSPADIRILLKEYNNLLGRLENDNYTTKGLKTADLNRFEERQKYIDKNKYLSRFYLDPSGRIINFDNSDNAYASGGGIDSYYEELKPEVDYYSVNYDDMDGQKFRDNIFDTLTEAKALFNKLCVTGKTFERVDINTIELVAFYENGLYEVLDSKAFINTYPKFLNNLQIEDGSKYIGQKFTDVFPYLKRSDFTPYKFKIKVKRYNNILRRLSEDNYSTKSMKTADLNRLEKIEPTIEKVKYLSKFFCDNSKTILSFDNSDNAYAGGGKVQPKDLTKINNFNNIQKGVDYYSYSDNLEKQEKADRWFELFVINQKQKQLNKIEFNEFMQLSNELAWEDLD